MPEQASASPYAYLALSTGLFLVPILFYGFRPDLRGQILRVQRDDHAACPGLPHETVLGAKEVGGHVVGISPAATLRDHVETFGSPYREYDVLIFTGLGLMGRELLNIRSSDIVVVIGGRSGTLGEFAIAYEEGKLIGVLTGTGGITAALSSIEATLHKDTGAEVIYESDPARLIDRLLARYQSPGYVCPCWPTGESGRRTNARSCPWPLPVDHSPTVI